MRVGKSLSCIMLATSLCISCKESVSDFKSTYRINDSTKVLFVPFEQANHTVDIQVYKDYLVTQSIKGDYSFNIYDMGNSNHIYRYGRIGRGPNEYLMVSSMSISNDSLMFVDNISRSINIIAINDIITGSENKIKKYTYPYTGDFRPAKIQKCSDGFISIGSYKESRLGYFDYSGKIIDKDMHYLYDTADLEGTQIGSVFQGLLVTDGQNRFAITTLSSDEFEIYEVHGNEVIHRYDNLNLATMPTLRDTPGKNPAMSIDYANSIAGYLDITADSRHIYMTYSNDNYSKVAEVGNKTNEIHCYNWAGDKICRLTLPVQINRITVGKNCIYGSSDELDGTVIYKFKLPEIL